MGTIIELVVVLCGTPAFAGDFSGLVTDVLDGDAIKISRNHRNVTIRLNGIDAPVKNKVYGHQSMLFVANHLVSGLREARMGILFH